MKILLLLGFACLGFSLSGQSIHKEFVINAGSGFIENEQFGLTYYVGDFIGYDSATAGIDLSDLIIYPNPVQSKLQFKTSTRNYKHIQVNRIDGVLVYQSSQQLNFVECSDWSSGVYILKLKNERNQIVESSLFIKK